VLDELSQREMQVQVEMNGSELAHEFHHEREKSFN
jgi:hypothetical protein